MTIKAIETIYNGIRFRSRLEARWAIFMDGMDIEWSYEAEGFTDGSLCYLPDFWLPEFECFIEIKPLRPTQNEIEKAWLPVKATGHDLFFFWGNPVCLWNSQLGSDYCHSFGLFRDECNISRSRFRGFHKESIPEREEVYIKSDERYWAQCPACGHRDIVFWGATEKLHCCQYNPGHSLAAIEHSQFTRAVFAANNHRFGGHT